MRNAPSAVNVQSLMKSDTAIAPETLRAYEETEYRVAGESPLVLRVGEPSPALAALHEARGVDSSAFITAWNPLGASLDDAGNAARQSELARELTARLVGHV